MKQGRKLFTMVLVVAMLIGMVPLESQAAGNVKLNKTSTSIYVGKTTTLKVVNTGKKVKWSSSNNNIAKVSSKGKVTGKKVGKAVITAKVSGKKYTCKVKVKNPYLSATKKTLTQGKSFTLEMKGSTVVKWSSSDKSVATVSSRGVVKAKKKGTAIITCKCKNGKKYKCKVTVKKKSNSGTVYIGNNDDEHKNNDNTNNGNTTPNTKKDDHVHSYAQVRTIKAASDTGFGEVEYACQVKGCSERMTKPYGNPETYTWTHPDTKETKTATRYGYWDTKSARDILEGINEYRREKGLSDLKYQAGYEPYMQQQVMHCYFGNSDFDIAPNGKTVRFVSGHIADSCHDKTFFQTHTAQPGNDGICNAELFERDDIEVGVACFAWTSYSSLTASGEQQFYSDEYWLQSTRYDVVICIFEDAPEQDK